MIRWLPFELHTHSVHSDAKFEVKDLVRAVKEIGFAGVALTDHNATSGQEELIQECETQGIVGIHGTEWTTFYGHMIVLGEHGCTDWRCYNIENIDEGLQKIRNNQGIVVITHPFAMSDPLLTGYHWQFEVKDYSLVNYIEVWSREFATTSVQSKNAFAMWDKILQQGYRIGGVSGRDWHSQDEDSKSYSYTYLGIQADATEESVLDALKAGRTYVTVGPKILLNIQDELGIIHNIGEEIDSKELMFSIQVDESENFENYQEHGIEPNEIRIIHNTDEIYKSNLNTTNQILLPVTSGYVRIEIWGIYGGKSKQRLIFTNPIYVK